MRSNLNHTSQDPFRGAPHLKPQKGNSTWQAVSLCRFPVYQSLKEWCLRRAGSNCGPCNTIASRGAARRCRAAGMGEWRCGVAKPPA
eukprot:6685644-Alexandrium_andersonii.AAC.1